MVYGHNRPYLTLRLCYTVVSHVVAFVSFSRKYNSLQMATPEMKLNFPAQIEVSKKKIRDNFKRSREVLRVRENILLSSVDEIENEYIRRTQELQELLEALDKNKSFTADTLTSNELTDTHQTIHSVINNRITKLIADTYCSIEFE